MFEPASRYFGLEVATFVMTDGRQVAYVRRRFVPSIMDPILLVEHTVSQGERLDNITANYLGDPQRFWQICDSNNVMHPDELTAEVGRKLQVSMPQI